MKQFIAIAVALVATARAAQAAPAWCKDASFDGDVDMSDLSSKDPSEVIVALAHATCAPTDESRAQQKEIDQSRAAWGKRLGMTDADWADVVDYVATNEGRDIHVEFSTKDATRFTPLDQYKALTDGFPMPGGNLPFKDPLYVTDMFDGNLSEVARYAYVDTCLRAEGSGQPPVATWAICQADLDAFDADKFADELRKDTAHRGDIKVALRLAAMDLKKRIKEHAAQVKSALAQDPVYPRMFEVAKQARADWAAGLGKRQDLLGLALRMDAAMFAGSRKLYEGCEDVTQKALADAIAKVPAGAFKGMQDQRWDPFHGFAQTAGPVLLENPEVNLAAIAYVDCAPQTGAFDFVATYLRDTPGFRGPRSAALSRLMLEKLQLDDMNARLEWPESVRAWPGPHGTVTSAGGVIASIKPEGDVLVVTLEKLIVKRLECTASHSTGRVERIHVDGRVDYVSVCDKSEVVTHNEQWDDFKIRKSYAPLLRKGVKFSVNYGADGKGDVLAIWPSKTAEQPSWLLGAVVK